MPLLQERVIPATAYRLMQSFLLRNCTNNHVVPFSEICSVPALLRSTGMDRWFILWWGG